jgi:hypothetical protein
VLQAPGLLMDRVERGWEVHSAGHRGIIFRTFKDAVEAVAQLAGAEPGDVTVRRDGSVVVHREEGSWRAAGSEGGAV